MNTRFPMAPSREAFSLSILNDFIAEDLDDARIINPDWFAAFDDSRLAIPGEADVDECLVLAGNAPTDAARGLILGQLEAHMRGASMAARRRHQELKNLELDLAAEVAPSDNWMQQWDDCRLAVDAAHPSECLSLALHAPTLGTRGMLLGVVIGLHS